LQWLDDNIPGICPNVSIGDAPGHVENTLNYYPNPGDGNFHFEGYIDSGSPLQMHVYDLTGRMIDRVTLQAGSQRFDYRLDRRGVFLFTITSKNGIVRSGKMIVL
jgi:hypothetical protein